MEVERILHLRWEHVEASDAAPFPGTTFQGESGRYVETRYLLEC